MATTAELLQGLIDSKAAIITSLKNKGVTIADNAKFNDLPDIITNADNIGGAEKKAVNFYDYDGTLLYSYTRDEALILTELPALPNRTSKGLTCQGWNWSLNDIQAELTNREDLDYLAVGAMYIPTDGATHINITMADKYRSQMPLMFEGDVTIDWGDGSTESVNHTYLTTITHEYAIAQSYPIKYTIKLTVNSGSLTLGGSSSSSNICGSTSQGTRNPARVYSARINSVFIGNGVTNINDYVFDFCYSLTTVTIPNSVTSIGTKTFYYCHSLASITIPNSVSSIGSNAFCYCYALTTVSIPNSVTSISDNAFFGCYTITSVTIPDSLTCISTDVFFNCHSIASIAIPNSVSSIGDSAFYGCTALSSITLPDSVSSIGMNAFSKCYSLASVTIPDSLTSLCAYAFDSCACLTSITIPNGLTSISTCTFRECFSLASVTIPNSVTNIDSSAFNYCYGIITYDFSTHTTVPTLYDTNVFSNTATDKQIVVPDDLYDEWIAATNWAFYESYIVKASEYVEP